MRLHDDSSVPLSTGELKRKLWSRKEENKSLKRERRTPLDKGARQCPLQCQGLQWLCSLALCSVLQEEQVVVLF
jgi:hypothetical protein